MRYTGSHKENASRSALILQHVDCEGLGYFEAPLAQAGLDLRFVRLNDGEAIPDVRKFDALIVLGGYMNVYEEDRYPFLREENEAIKEAVGRKIPYLGICLGAQLLAKALGAKVYPNSVKEIGFYNIQLTEYGKDEPLFGGLPDKLEVFQWHGDTYDLPGGAKLLATSELCANQAFSYENAYGLQFHLETTPGMISEWCSLYREELSRFDNSLMIKPGKALASKTAAKLMIKNFINIVNASH